MAGDQLELGIDEERPDLSVNAHSALDDSLNGTNFFAVRCARIRDQAIVVSKSPHTAEQKRYLEETVETTLPNVRKAFKKVGVIIPSDGDILSEIITTNRFTREQVWALMRAIEVPGLIVLPKEMKLFDDYIKLRDSNLKTLQYRRLEGDRRLPLIEQGKKLVAEGRPQYKFGIGEMVQEPKNREGKLRDIVNEWEGSYFGKFMRPPTFTEHAVLSAQAPYLLDLEGWSMLAEENSPHAIIGKDDYVFGASGEERRLSFIPGVNFRGYSAEEYCNTARIRPVVVG